MVLVFSISNFFTNKNSQEGNWVGFSCSNSALVHIRILFVFFQMLKIIEHEGFKKDVCAQSAAWLWKTNIEPLIWSPLTLWKVCMNAFSYGTTHSIESAHNCRHSRNFSTVLTDPLLRNLHGWQRFLEKLRLGISNCRFTDA